MNRVCSKSDNAEKVRYGLIDALRAVAVINMIAYHLCYDIFCAFGVWVDFASAPAAVVWERFICCSFIVISGISLNFTHRGYYRGAVVLICGAVVSAVTLIFMPDQVIWFGILSFLGCAMLITYAARKPLGSIPPLAGTVIFFILFMLCYGIPHGYIGIFEYSLIALPKALYELKWLAFLGFPGSGFFSADYFPLLQWIFLYMSGYMLWRFICKSSLDRSFRADIPVLGFIGRHSLVIYMAHQPALYAACALVLSPRV